MSLKAFFSGSRRLLGSLALALAVFAACAACAAAAPVIEMHAHANTSAAPGEAGLQYTIDVRNVGNEPTSGPLTLRATLPARLQATGSVSFAVHRWECEAGQFPTTTVMCTNTGPFTPLGAGGGVDNSLSLVTEVESGAPVGVLTPKFELWGDGTITQADGEACGLAPGETPCDTTVRPTLITPAAPKFGVGTFDSAIVDSSGNPFTQAAGHPYSITTWVDFNTYTNPKLRAGQTWPVEPAKNVVVELPPGFVGATSALAKCTLVELAHTRGATTQQQPLCPAASQAGVADITVDNGIELFHVPVYNVVPPPGIPAAFGFNVAGVTVLMVGELRSGSDYGLSVRVKDAPEVPLSSAKFTFWGVPGDSSHDRERMCPEQDPLILGGKTCPSGLAHPPAFLRNPTSCTAPGEGLVTGLSADSWTHPGVFVHASVTSHALPGYPLSPNEWGAPVGIAGCDAIPFDPGFSLAPTSRAVSSPTGLDVDVSLPQSSDATVAGSADMESAVVKLPKGLRVNPSAANGLGACSSSQIGLVGTGFPAPNPTHFTSAEATCPDSAKIGTITIETPLLSEPVAGSIYLATQGDNPFGSLLAAYLVAKAQGVLVKLPLHIEADPQTGQLTARLDDAPQQPFSHVRLHFFSGSHAALITPEACGSYITGAQFGSWAQPDATVSRNDLFALTSNTDGGACPSSRSFAPAFTAGTVDPQAGAFSQFVLSFSRKDTESTFGGLSMTLPPGVSAILNGVPLCSDSDASAGSCPAGSRIGSVTVGSGAGPDPFFLKGQVFLTGPYNGGSYGEVVVVPAVAGPFNLGNVEVRGSIRVDPYTAQAMVVSDAFPQFVGSTGIPTDVRHVDVVLDREKFTFNPTSCEPESVTGALSPTQGATAAVSSRFRAVNCATLGFKPSFKASTSAKTSRTNGASLHVSLLYPKAPFGSQANIKSVHVELPKALPSRLSTLNHACPDAVFNQNPASCPSQSRVGFAKAVTPVLPVPLEGPAYFVSHGGQRFPELIMVLQGYGITLDLAGETFISKAGITSSTFKSVPDVPVGSFELTLPQGPFSALAANRNLCETNLVMPTKMTAQNGAVLKQSTKIAVTGCKPAIRVVGHSVKGAHARVRVTVPTAGTLVATGSDIKRSVGRAARAGSVTIGVALTSRGVRVLAKNPHQRVDANVKLRFSPKHGAPLTAYVRLLMG